MKHYFFSRTTLLSYAERWLARHQCNISPTTYEGYDYIIHSGLAPFFKNILLKDVSSHMIQDYYNYLLTTKKLSPNTVRHHHVILRKILSYAYQNEDISKNPTDFVELPKIKSFCSTVYNKEEARLLLSKIASSHIKVPIMIGMFLAVRRSENLGLTWDCVDFDRRIVFLNMSVVNTKCGVLVKNVLKTENSKRCLPIPLILLDFLKEWKLEQARTQPKKNNFICTMPDGTLMKPTYVSKEFQKFLKQHHLKKILFKDLRATLATLLVAENENIYYLADFLGHTSVKTTEKFYVHLVDERKMKVADHIDQLFEQI